ncbi:TPA: hypothetical protein KML76_003005 [Escherichia coli]|uniref:hypothetical protein n=1 Tax=Escherichia coli TaxID=562 RepID=UPI0015C54CB2|nr:hypothetical protein [Escherichia coli]HBE6752538.1 hypothetical protein [Escherichia coli]HBE6852925.1 hypothetical protein [Escherichia coli]HCM9651798.1 hypothetical protein [Enterobacter kobei]
MNLTIKQIYELASFAGLMCSSPEESQVDEETEICIDNGVIHDDDGQVEYEGLRACCADYPEEGYIPLED